MKGFELFDEEKDRSKYSEEQIKKFQHWVLNGCELVIDNPFKNDTVWKRDIKSECEVYLAQCISAVIISNTPLFSLYR